MKFCSYNETEAPYLSVHPVHPGQEMVELIRWEDPDLVPVAAAPGAEVVILGLLRLAGLSHVLSLRQGGDSHEGPGWSLGGDRLVVAQLGGQAGLVAGLRLGLRS